jgi:aconitate hydratase
MGVLPLQFQKGEDAKSLGLTGRETFDIEGLGQIAPGSKVSIKFTREDGTSGSFKVLSRIDTANEVEYFRHGGILQYVLRQAMGKA